MAEKRARYKIELENGEVVEFEGPGGLTDDQVTDLADKYLRDAKPGQEFEHSVYGGVEEPKHDASESSAFGSFMRGLPKDASFNFADELTSLGNAAIPGMAELDNLFGVAGSQQGPLSGDAGSFWERVAHNMAETKGQAEADEALHLLASGFGRVAGVLSTLPRAGAAVAARLPEAITARMAARPVSSAIALGAGGGGVSGAGAGEPGSRGQSAAIGTLAGGALGGTVAGGLELAPAIARYGKIFFNRASKTEAVQQIVKALQRDGFDVTSPSGVQKLRSALQEYSGKPVSLADIGGATRSRAGVGMRAPSEAQQTAIDSVRARQAGQGQRLAGDIRTGIAPRTDIHAIDEALVEQRATQAKTLRDRALFEDTMQPHPTTPASVAPVASTEPNAGVIRTLGGNVDDTFAHVTAVTPPGGTIARQSRIVNDPELQGLARLPDAQKALTGALERVESERALLAAQGKDTSHLPDLTRGSDLDMRAFDYLKRYLDDEVSSLYRRGDTATFKAGQAAQVKALRDTIREKLRAYSPEYADYLDAYKGSSEMIDSLAEGRTFGNLDPEEIVAGQAGRSTAGQELYRTGAARNLLDVIRDTRDTSNPASRIANSPESRAQIEALGLQPQAAQDLFRKIGQERTFNLLPQELAGSQTAQRAIAQADANAGADMAVPFNPGSPYGWMGMVGRTILNRTSVNRNAAVNNELLPRLMATDPQAVDSIITELEQQGQFNAAQQLRELRRVNKSALVGGAVIGSPVALPGD